MSALRIGAPMAVADTIRVPGDKSISHRAVMLAAIARGTTMIRGLNMGDDVAATIAAMRALGTIVAGDASAISVTGSTFSDAAGVIDCGNSGTTMRLCMGLLAGRTACTLDGDASLRRRPMERVANPLRFMGAAVTTEDGRPPVRLGRGDGRLRGIDYSLPIASAQVKSALLIAGLRADGVTTVRSPYASRDHTERMLSAMGAPIEMHDGSVSISSGSLTALETYAVPGDFSAAIFFVVALAFSPRAGTTIVEVGVNPTRTAALEVMRSMGVRISERNGITRANEPSSSLSIEGGGAAQPVRIGAHDVPNLIDEIPALTALAALGGVRLEVHGAAELRVKESDRIAVTAGLLRAFGARVDELEDGMIVHEGRELHAPERVETLGDHRLGLTAAALAAALGSSIEIGDADCIATSFPDFAATWSAAFGCTVTKLDS